MPSQWTTINHALIMTQIRAAVLHVLGGTDNEKIRKIGAHHILLAGHLLDHHWNSAAVLSLAGYIMKETAFTWLRRIFSRT